MSPPFLHQEMFCNGTNQAPETFIANQKSRQLKAYNLGFDLQYSLREQPNQAKKKNILSKNNEYRVCYSNKTDGLIGNDLTVAAFIWYLVLIFISIITLCASKHLAGWLAWFMLKPSCLWICIGIGAVTELHNRLQKQQWFFKVLCDTRSGERSPCSLLPLEATTWIHELSFLMPNGCSGTKIPPCALLQQLPPGTKSTPELVHTAWCHLVTQWNRTRISAAHCPGNSWSVWSCWVITFK